MIIYCHTLHIFTYRFRKDSLNPPISRILSLSLQVFRCKFLFEGYSVTLHHKTHGCNSQIKKKFTCHCFFSFLCINSSKTQKNTTINKKKLYMIFFQMQAIFNCCNKFKWYVSINSKEILNKSGQDFI